MSMLSSAASETLRLINKIDKYFDLILSLIVLLTVSIV
jgi:hypothetical protein